MRMVFDGAVFFVFNISRTFHIVKLIHKNLAQFNWLWIVCCKGKKRKNSKSWLCCVGQLLADNFVVILTETTNV